MVITTCNLIFLISSVSGNIYIIYVIKNFQTEMTLDLSKAQTAIKAIMWLPNVPAEEYKIYNAINNTP